MAVWTDSRFLLDDGFQMSNGGVVVYFHLVLLSAPFHRYFQRTLHFEQWTLRRKTTTDVSAIIKIFEEGLEMYDSGSESEEELGLLRKALDRKSVV